MRRLLFFKNIIAIVFLVGAVYTIANYTGPVKDNIFAMLHIQGGGVKGASTKKAQEISGKFSSDIRTQADMVKDQALKLKVSDILGSFSRLQKIPQDINIAEEYAKNQLTNLLQNKKK